MHTHTRTHPTAPHVNTRIHAQTRSPHTIAPDKPITGNVVMNRLTAPIDKLRDAVSGRFAHKPGEHHQEAHAGAAAAPPAGPA
jgi:hypothetical protein